MIRDAHFKFAAFLRANADVILLPRFGTSAMVARQGPGGKRRCLSAATARHMQTWSHYTFKQRVRAVAEERGVAVVEADEAYTSVTCGAWRHLHTRLGGARVYRCQTCLMEASRDGQAARSILVKWLCSDAAAVAGLPTDARRYVGLT